MSSRSTDVHADAGTVPTGVATSTTTTSTNRRPISTVEEKTVDFLCPICFDLINVAYITRCGHTFCYQCIFKSIESFKRCPKCNSALTSSADHIFPNFLLDELISKHKIKTQAIARISNNTRVPQEMGYMSKTASAAANARDGDELIHFITSETEKLALPDVNVILEILQQRKQLLESESSTAHNRLLHEFLKHLLRQKEDQAAQITKEIDLVSKDMVEVQGILNDISGSAAMPPEVVQLLDEIDDSMTGSATGNEGFNSFRGEHPAVNFQSRKRRMHAHFEDFVKSYFSVRSQNLYTSKEAPDADAKVAARQGLDVFRENLVKFSKYNTLRPLATMQAFSDLHNSTIVSAIAFDKDNEYFAIGGVTKRIKIFDYLAVIQNTVDFYYPAVEMISNSKISCIDWNSYHKNILVSSDYEGAVDIWDVQVGTLTKSFHEHERRCWSVDFNAVDTRLIASGSDDARVKLWSTNDERSIATLEAKAKVCCVKFNPKSSCHLAFGSADHDVHYYDLRNMSKALCVFKGHKKAVSYVKFLNTDELISASTDSQLKLWNINQPSKSLRTFFGHVNEKHFVGLATDGDYVACGSEDNSMYIYYKGLSKQLFSFKIDGHTTKVSDTERPNNLEDFVSAVCWRKGCNVVLAANNRGLLQILELV